MKSNKFSLLLFAFFGLFLTFPALAQEKQSFSDVNAEYRFDLPDQMWKITAKPTTISPNVEYVYGDRKDGHLEVRKLTLKPDGLLMDLIEEEEGKLQFLPGYVAGKEEQFSGILRGTVFNYEYVRAGRNMSGRFYFLKAAPNTVYVLRFTGERDKLRSIRNFTDSIARTFDLKKS